MVTHKYLGNRQYTAIYDKVYMMNTRIKLFNFFYR